MYVATNAGLGRYRGMGDVTYDAEGMPVEDPANTTWGDTSGGRCPGSPGCPGNVQPSSGTFCLTPTFPWIGKTVPGAPGVCSGVASIPDPWGNILTVAFPALILFGLFRRGR